MYRGVYNFVYIGTYRGVNYFVYIGMNRGVYSCYFGELYII